MAKERKNIDQFDQEEYNWEAFQMGAGDKQADTPSIKDTDSKTKKDTSDKSKSTDK